VFAEAHCLSQRGTEFRPDYLYVARFIKELSAGGELAPIGCFTATAKPDVLEDIEQHFHEQLGVGFRKFIGSPERTNLAFDVLPCSRQEKWARSLELLNAHLGDNDGGAVIFVASRRKAEELASFIAGQGWACQHFHAGIEPNEKKDIQDAFKASQLRVIVATNAFGMGVDKADIRLVVHAEIPGSLENYLQEAGRAGRDQKDARCILLYDPNDIENQFSLSEQSRLTFRDIQQILRKLRLESGRRKGEPLIITAGEILQDEEVDTSFDLGDHNAETKVVTAISWLERGDYLKRESNVTRIFPAKMGASPEEAARILDSAKLPLRKRREFEALLDHLRRAGPDQRVSTDDLMQLTASTPEEVTGALHQMEALGLLVNDTRLTLYLRHGVTNSAEKQLPRVLRLEQALFELLAEAAPDAADGTWQDLCLSALTTTLKERVEDDGVLPIHVMRLLKSLSRDRSGDTSQRSFELRALNQDYFKLRVLNGYRWAQLEKLGEKRRALAGLVVSFLIGKLPPDLRSKDAMVETSFGELEEQIAGDLTLAATIAPAQRRRAVEHVLLYLHQQEIVVLNHGMTVMRQAMTIEVNNELKGRYRKSDFNRLEEHYRERTIQVHVMRQYAEIALKAMADALRLVIDYFSQSREDFLRRYFPGKEEVLDRATSEESWEAIVAPLSPSQRLAVVDDNDTNRLILAGPGSGKTRVIVHRIAYLLRARRVPARAVLALTFTRHAANEIRKRLQVLVGPDAWGVTVLTYHSLAMRMTGTRFQRNETVDEQRLTDILTQAVSLLEGATIASGEDELRDQLLGGYRYILVDEYQDIDEMQYRLVAALAGRHADQEQRLCIVAVGDDDQNIYAWRNTSNRYIERFRADYDASIDYLVENYRSTRHIIEAANGLIAHNSTRLKQQHPIRIDRARERQPPGGTWQTVDGVAHGQVLRLLLPRTDSADGNLQAQAATRRLATLMGADDGDCSGCAILARTHKYLAPVQAWCEQNGVPYHLAADKGRAPALTRHRTFVHLVDALATREAPVGADGLLPLLEVLAPDGDWFELLAEATEQLRLEFGEAELQGQLLIDWLYDYFREIRHKPAGGLYLGTVHSAKGLEFPHVVLLDGGWSSDSAAMEDERRLYYVGMTRAAGTLTLCEFAGGNRFSSTLDAVTTPLAWQGDYDARLCKHYRSLALNEVDIGYAGRFAPGAPIHKKLSRLRPGGPLQCMERDGRYLFVDAEGFVVGRTAAAFRLTGTIESCSVAAVVVRYADDSEEPYRSSCKSSRWEVVIPRLVLTDSGAEA
jgi:ATP-dependent DNA helicase RecQ